MASNGKSLHIGAPAPESRVYRCSSCGSLNALLEKDTAPHCETCEVTGKSYFWTPTSKRIMPVSRDISKEFDKRKKWYDHASDLITAFCGSMSFVVLHILWFGFWIVANMGKIPGIPLFDPFPYGLLTMIVSLEAILLATFILISQNRAGAKAELRSEYDYQIDLKSEKHIAEILQLLKEQKKKKK